MIRSTWAGLPADVRDALQEHVGAVTGFGPVESGNHAELTGTARTATGPVFLKGATEGVEARLLRYEARVLPAVTRFAPRLLAHVEAGGWTVLALEHIEGRHADFSPGSPGLLQVAKLITSLSGTPAPDPVTMRVAARWEDLIDTTPLDGVTLLHADINSANVLITPDGACLVDWAFTSRGAPWAEPGLMIPWLLKAGHTPAEAEAWAAQFLSWMTPDPGYLTTFAAAFAERWRQRATRDGAEEWVHLHATLTRRWADHRSRGRAP